MKKKLIIYAIATVVVLLICIGVLKTNRPELGIDFIKELKASDEVSYPKFLEMLSQGRVISIYYNTGVEDMLFSYKFDETASNPDNYVHFLKTKYPAGDTFRRDMLVYGVNLVLVRNDTFASDLLSILVALSPTIIMGITLLYFLHIYKQTNSNKDMRESLVTTDTGVTFDDILGIDEIRDVLLLIVKLIKNPDYGKDLGVKLPHGILLTGLPGVGKTLIAKAIAHSCGLPFISVSGSDFKNIYVGNGARRVRQVFAIAREVAPCIVFIDEIDSIGSNRDKTVGDSEGNQTINAILKEMDGFTPLNGIFILAATNHPENLDSALKRAGRFDREILIPAPRNWETIRQLYNHYLKDKKLSDDVDLEIISKNCIGYTGADISSICNEAAIVALSHEHKCINFADIEEAIEHKMFKGEVSKIKPSEKDKRLVSVHESGHAVASYLLGIGVSKITIRGMTSGVGGFVQSDNKLSSFETENDIKHKVEVAYAGRAAEELVYGEVSTGIASDMQAASEMLYEYVAKYAFTEHNKVAYATLTKELKDTISVSMNEVSNALYEEIKHLLEDNLDKVRKLADIVYEKETLTKDEVKQILEEE